MSSTETVRAQWAVLTRGEPSRDTSSQIPARGQADFPKATAPGLFCTGRQDCFKECFQAVDKSVKAIGRTVRGWYIFQVKCAGWGREVPQQRGWGRRWEVGDGFKDYLDAKMHRALWLGELCGRGKEGRDRDSISDPAWVGVKTLGPRR